MSGVSSSRANGIAALRHSLLAWTVLGLWVTAAPAQQASDREAKLLLENARRSYNEKNYQAASARFREFLTKYSTNKDAPAARYGLALTLLESPERDYQGAFDQLKPLAGNPAFAEYAQVLYHLGSAQRGLGLKELAQTTLKSQDAAKHRTAAREHFEQAAKQFAAAAPVFAARVAEVAPGAKELPADLEWSIRARCDQAEMQLRTGKVAEVKDTLAPLFKDACLKRSRYCDLAFYYQGVACYLLEEYLGAGRALNQRTLFHDPVFGTHARYLLGRIHQRADERAEAIAQYEGAIGDYEYNKKNAVEALKRPERFRNDPAEKARLEALVRDPTPEHVGQAMFHLGLLHYESGRFSEAAARLSGFVKLFPQSPLWSEAQLRLGFTHVQLKQFPEAVRTLQPLIDKEPRLADQVLLWLGRAQMGNADPNNTQAHQQALRLGLQLLRLADDKAQALLTSDPSVKVRGEIQLEIADTQLLAGMNKEAATTYEKLLADETQPGHQAEILQRLAAALNLAGEYEASDKVCARFQKMYPNSPLLPAVFFRHAENAYFTARATEKNSTLPNRAQELARLDAEAAKRYQALIARFPDFEHTRLARYGLALMHYRKGDYEKAKEAFEAIPASDRMGELAQVPYLLADCLIRLAPVKADDALAAGRLQENLQSAIELLEGFAGSQPKSPQTPDALLKLGHCQQRLAVMLVQPKERMKLLTVAQATYDRLRQQYPNHELQPMAVFEKAKCRLQAGDIGGAMNYLQRFAADPLRKAPVAPMVLLQTATVLRGQNRAAEAVNLLGMCRQQHEASLLKDPERAGWVPLLQYHQGLCLKEAGKLPEALALLDGVVKQFADRPEAAEAVLRAAQCQKELGQRKIDQARKMPAGRPEEAAVRSRLIQEGLNDIRQAVDRLSSQADSLKGKEPAIDIRARLLYEAARSCRMMADVESAIARQNGKLEPPIGGAAESKARALYQTLIDALPDSPQANDARLELSELLADRGEHDAAIKLLSDAIDKEPPPELTDRVRLQLGTCLSAKGDSKAAMNQFETVLRNPKSPLLAQAHYRAGESLMRAGDAQAASPHFSVFRDQPLFRNLPGLTDRALLRLGQVYAHRKDWDKSRQAYEQLYSRFDNSPWAAEARYGFAWACWNQKQYDAAVNVLSRIAERGGNELAARAQLLIGLCRLEQKRYPEAVAALGQVPAKFKVDDWSALALVETARALAGLKQRDQAELRLEQVLREYPKSKWADAAKSQLKTLNEGKPLQRPELLVDPRTLAMDVNPIGPLPVPSQPPTERASLEDPTSDVSFKAVLATPLPERKLPAPFVRLTLPEPFEHHLPPRGRTVLADETLPIAIVLPTPR